MGWDRFVRGGPAALANPLAPLPGANAMALTDNLEPGASYAVVMMVDPKAALGSRTAPASTALQVQEIDSISHTIGDGLAQVGLSPLANAVPASTSGVPGDKPSQWDLIARWQGPGAMISARPGYITQINFYKVPTFA
jgi:hypothetical protein